MLTNPNCEYEANYVAIHTLAQWSKNINTNFVKSSSKGLVTLTESERESENFISSLPPLSENGKSISSRPVYTKRQRQRCDDSAMTLVILFSLKPMELLQNRVVTFFQVTLLFSITTKLLASLQSCYSVDANACCKRALSSHLKAISLSRSRSLWSV